MVNFPSLMVSFTLWHEPLQTLTVSWGKTHCDMGSHGQSWTQRCLLSSKGQYSWHQHLEPQWCSLPRIGPTSWWSNMMKSSHQSVSSRFSLNPTHCSQLPRCFWIPRSQQRWAATLRVPRAAPRRIDFPTWDENPRWLLCSSWVEHSSHYSH
jgi:hypothetical protein